MMWRMQLWGEFQETAGQREGGEVFERELPEFSDGI